MKISEFTDNSHIDELDAADVGNAAGKATRAVGTGAKKVAGAVGSGVKNFAKGFGAGIMGKPNPADKMATTKSSSSLNTIKSSISKLNPKQQAALRKQLAKKAGVA
jgi:hypothetical protein